MAVALNRFEVIPVVNSNSTTDEKRKLSGRSDNFLEMISEVSQV